MPAFSLPEILVVLGIFAILASASLPWNMDTYMRAIDRDDNSAIFAALIRARGESLAGDCGGYGGTSAVSCSKAISHGVHIATDSLILFEGINYPDRNRKQDESLPFNGKLAEPVDVVFEAGSAHVLTPATITLLSKTTFDAAVNDLPIGVYSIEVNTEGAIAINKSIK